MSKIEWTRKAEKQLSKLDRTIQPTIVLATRELHDYKNLNSVKRLTNHQYDYRMRVRNYRVLFNVFQGDVEIISIEEVKKRDESTY